MDVTTRSALTDSARSGAAPKSNRLSSPALPALKPWESALSISKQKVSLLFQMSLQIDTHLKYLSHLSLPLQKKMDSSFSLHYNYNPNVSLP